jgi:2-keto-3-deoxy-L-fuconate dehydrogenase
MTVEDHRRHADDFAGLIAVVTGAASGIGLATARLLADRGAEVIGIDCNPIESIETFSRCVVLDVSDATAIDAFARTLSEALDRVDVLVNCAGISPLGSVEETSVPDWDRVFAVNVRGPWLMTKAMLPLLRRSRVPAIVNVASGIGLRPVPRFAAYAASKAALIALTRSTAVELASDRVRANCVCPGPTDTPLMRWALSETGHAATGESTVELADASEVAEAIALLASPRASHIVGSTLAVDQGRTLH